MKEKRSRFLDKPSTHGNATIRIYGCPGNKVEKTRIGKINTRKGMRRRISFTGGQRYNRGAVAPIKTYVLYIVEGTVGGKSRQLTA